MHDIMRRKKSVGLNIRVLDCMVVSMCGGMKGAMRRCLRVDTWMDM